MYYIIIIFLIVILLILLYYVYTLCIADIDEIIKDIPDVKWPFINLKDENDKNINMLGIRGPFSSDTNDKKNQELFRKYKRGGIKFIGCSSYLTYPGLCENPHGYCHTDNNQLDGINIEDHVLGWCHCFREPEKYIRGNVPKILISESDFNSDSNKPDDNIEIEYDFVTYQPNDEKCELKWNSHNKNWPLAEYCIKILCDELNLKGVIIGRDNCPIDIKNKDNLIVTPYIEHHVGIDYIRKSKFLLCPNYEDASPRTLAESLSLDTPLLVYEDIIGGWKYVTDETGLFFNRENFKSQVKQLLHNIDNKKYKPREHYINNYTLKNSGKQLKDFLKSLNPELCDCEYVKFPVS